MAEQMIRRIAIALIAAALFGPLGFRPLQAHASMICQSARKPSDSRSHIALRLEAQGIEGADRRVIRVRTRPLGSSLLTNNGG
jgi:hypothetical protein